MTTETNSDHLKPLSEISEPDNRSEIFNYRLEGIHNALSKIMLNQDVPDEVIQLFETSKNLSLYSWHVYNFHQVSEFISFTALEMALRLRYEAENPDEKKRTSLYGLINHAKDHKWISNERFPNRYETAYRNAHDKKVQELIMSGTVNGKNPTPIEEPTDAEIEAAFAELDEVGAIAKTVNKFRNFLAHGSVMIRPGSISTLRVIANLINQIYS